MLPNFLRSHIALLDDATVPVFEQFVDGVVGAKDVVDHIPRALFLQLILHLVVLGEALRTKAGRTGVAQIQNALLLANLPELALREGRR